MKKIYIFAAVLALLTLSLNAQDGKLKTASDMRLKTSSKNVKDPKVQAPTIQELVRGIKGMSSVLQAAQDPTTNSSANHAPLRINAGEELMGPFTTYDTSVSGYNSYGWSTAYGNNYQQIYVFADLDRSAFEGHDGDEIVGYRFALGGNTSQTAVLYDFMAWPYSTNGYFEAANRHTWRISESAGAVPQTAFDDIVITVPSYYAQFHSITVYGDNNTVITSWSADETTVTSGDYTYYEMPDGWELSNVYMFSYTINNVKYGYLSSDSEASITISSNLLSGNNSISVVIEAISASGAMTVDVNGDTRNLTTTQSTNTWTFSPTGTTTPVYQELQAGQWYEYYLNEPIPFNVADSIGGMYLGYRFFQFPSTETSELLNPVAINPNSNTAGIVTNRYGQSGTTNAVGDITITIPSTYTNIRSITVTSGNTTITSYSYANNSTTLPSGWSFDGTIGLRSDYGNVASLYSSDGTGVLTLSGDLFTGYSSVTVSIYFSTSTRNQTATVSVNGTNRTTTSRTGSTQTWTVNATTVPTYSGGWWDENIAGDLAVQLIFKSSLNPTIEMTPATQTINDAAAGSLTVTGTDIEGNINVSAADNDWSVNPASLGNTGGNVSVTYTGRDLSATTTVTASATGATDATATVDYVADLYIVGNFGSGWDFTNGTSMSYNNGTYTATLTVDAGNYILFARLLGNSNPWNTRDVFGPSSNGDWWMQGNSATGNIDLNDDDPIYFPEGGTYRITIDANNGTFTITKLNGEQTAQPVISSAVSADGEYVTITATGDGTVTLNVPGYDPVSGEGEVSITVPCGYVSNTITVSATAQESGKDESDPTYRDITIPAGSDWVEMDGTYDNPNDLLSFLKNNEDIMMVDQFAESTLKNDHPDHYTYTLRQTVNGETTTSTPVSIPVYKTNSSMQGLYTKNQVDVVDKNMSLRPNVVNTEMDFDVNPDRNVLYYSLYRGDLNATYPEITAQSRVSQLQKFEEMVGEGENAQPQYFLFESHPEGIAPRYDRLGTAIAERLDTNWVEAGYDDQLAYVPVIWTYGLYTARGDGKNNSYGSDIKREYMGKVDATITGTYTAGNDYGTWKVGETEYCVFHPTITVTGVLPQNDNNNVVLYKDEDEATYVPYMCRAWCTYEGIHDFIRNSDGNLQDAGALPTPYWLGDAIFDGSNTATIGGEWTGGSVRDQWSFGLPSGTSPDEVTYIIRFYYKKVVTEGQQNGSKGKFIGGAAEEYFMAETGGEFGEWVVGVNELYNGIVPVDVTYVNPQGMQSSRPFDGVNIVVTRYSDGSTRTSKIIR